MGNYKEKEALFFVVQCERLACSIHVFVHLGVPSEPKERGDINHERGERKVCRFKLDWLGNCSGLNDDSYGYREGKPCIIIKLNRVLGFKPKASASYHLTFGGWADGERRDVSNCSLAHLKRSTVTRNPSLGSRVTVQGPKAAD